MSTRVSKGIGVSGKPAPSGRVPAARGRGAAAGLCLALLLLSLAVHGYGCSSSTPERAVRDFVAARMAGNDRRAAELTVEGDLGEYPGGEPYLGGSGFSYRVSEVLVEGDGARVTVAFSWDDQEVEVPYVTRRVGSRWKVSLEETLEGWLPSPQVKDEPRAD